MRKSFRVLCSLMLALVVMVSATTVFKADTTTKDDVSVEITTDKESYSAGEEIQVTVVVTNNSKEELTDVNVRVNWPEGITFGKAEDKVLVIDALAAGASQTYEVQGVKASSNLPFIILIAVIIIALLIVFVVGVIKNNKNKKAAAAATTLVVAMLITLLPTTIAEAGVTINAQKTVTIGGTEAAISATVTYSQYYMGRLGRVTVHDPSVVYDPETDMYYIFGSHMAWAKSKDLINWTSFKNNINTDYRTIFAEPASWAAKGSSSYNVSGNMWAPDVIYNEKLGKWCMYIETADLAEDKAMYASSSLVGFWLRPQSA